MGMSLLGTPSACGGTSSAWDGASGLWLVPARHCLFSPSAPMRILCGPFRSHTWHRPRPLLPLEAQAWPCSGSPHSCLTS